MSQYDRYAPVAWGDELFDVRCPSGQVCQVRKLDMVDMVELDLVDQFDSLTPVVGQGDAKKPSPQDRKKSAKVLKAEEEAQNNEFTKNLLKDKSKLGGLLLSIDKALERAVIQPALRRPITKLADGTEIELPFADREKGVVYTSQIGFEDKMYIFDKVFQGAGDLEPFREESEDGVGDVAEEPVS